MTEHPVARVLPESRLPQLDRLFDYAIPEGMDVRPGVRVRVPMGRGGRLQAGFVVEVLEKSSYEGTLSPIEHLVSPVPVVPPELYRLAQAVASRQAGGVADILRLAVAPRAVRVEKAWLKDSDDSTVTTEPPLDSPTASSHYDPEQWSALWKSGAKHWWQLPYGSASAAEGEIPAGHREIARLAATVLAAGSSVVVCVPDWRDQLFVDQALREWVEAEALAPFVATETPTERYRSYLRTLEARPSVAYGARHAIYAPVSNLGLVLVLSDSDDLHREPLAPYPHSRDVALLRAEQTGAAVVFASHVPSLPVLRLMQMGYLGEVRAQQHTRPRVIPTALGRLSDDVKTPARLPSVAYRAVVEAITQGPVLVQVFHSGYSPGLSCRSCGERARCVECGGPLKTAKRSGPISCGWCGHLATLWSCNECGGSEYRPSGHGVGRTTHELGRAFPGVPIIQSDGESRTARVPGTPALVVATRGAEPVAQGGYRAALLLDAESMLQRASLNALEDTLQGWEWAMSLLAPGAIAYLTDLEGPVAQSVAAGGLEVLLARELVQRGELRMPPTVRLAAISGPRGDVEDLVASLTGPDSRHAAGGQVDALGPIRHDSQATYILRMSYRVAPDIAPELRAAVVRSASKGPRQTARLKVVMDDVDTLDALAVEE
ncbi:primosomal protein N' [Pontimonas sp.]|uniref:primosomal protein N' family DNA-binding protein n=1 Tax=Pontimonas sp. TaxID=2304492 RepID=UPI0028700FF4|nr:primosomal protein N' [Pontimonas sp.]MDR9396471.1 primosomal protein N' [Pontimonas sp.]